MINYYLKNKSIYYINMSMFQELEYNSEIEKVGGVQFSILSPDETRRRSVAEVYTNETYGWRST